MESAVSAEPIEIRVDEVPGAGPEVPDPRVPLAFHPEKRAAVLTSIVDNLLDAVLVISQARRIEFANATASRILKAPLDKLLEKTVFDIFPEKGDGNVELHSQIEQVFSSNGATFGSGGRATMVAADGSRASVILIQSAVRNGPELLGVGLSFRVQQPLPGSGAASLDKDSKAGPANAARQKVTKALESRMALPEHSFVVILALSQFDMFRLRYGQSNAEKLVRVFSSHVLESLGPGDRLYEWSSRTLLLLLERDSSLDEVRLEMTSLCSRRLDYFLDASERSALVTLSATWNLLPMEDTTVEKIIATVDSFDKAHTRKR